MIDDTKKEVSLEILHKVLNVKPDVVTRFTNGYCHSVYCVKAKGQKYVLRITSKDNEKYYQGSVKWLQELATLGIPVPQIIAFGQYDDVFYSFITFIEGRDLGEVYHTLTESQKRNIVRNLTAIQVKVSTLPHGELFGYNAFPTWAEHLENLIDRSFQRIRRNNIFDANICDGLTSVMRGLHEYFSSVEPVPFLDDITTKNVMIHKGKLAGIVDVDEICYGDPMLAIGLTNMALLSMGADTKYIDYWLDEIKANDTQRNAVRFYTLLFCVDFMSEQGMRFGNDNIVPVKQDVIDLLSTTYNMIISTC